MNNHTDLQFLTWFTLHRISELISKNEEKLFQNASLSKTQHNILLTLAFLIECKEKPIIITDLVPYLNRSLMSISLITDRMEKKGLVKKIRDLPDRRVVRIKMTSKGKKYLKESSSPTTELITKIFSVFSDPELKQTVFLLNKLLKIVEEETDLKKDISFTHKSTIKQKITFLQKLSG
jgi:DNA-binding MarR family transcriptional regulator